MLCLLVGIGPAVAQDDAGWIWGVVNDQLGSLLPGVTVAAQQAATGLGAQRGDQRGRRLRDRAAARGRLRGIRSSFPDSAPDPTAARVEGAETIVDPRPWAVGSIAETFGEYPHIGAILPAMGYGGAQLAELAETVNAVECDVIVTGTPIELGRIIEVGRPIRQARYAVEERGRPRLEDVLAPLIADMRQ